MANAAGGGFLNWHIPRRRVLLIVAAVTYYAMRVWTYFYFAPTILALTDPAAGPPSSADVELLSHWLDLDLIRGIIQDILSALLFFMAAFVPALPPTYGPKGS